MDKKIIIACLLLWVTTASCGQNREYSGDEAKALQVAKEFTEAIYHGEYERAKSLSFDFNAGEIARNHYVINDINRKISRKCIQKKVCPKIDPNWAFNLLRIRSIPIKQKDGGEIKRFRVDYECKPGFYSILDVTIDDQEKTYKISQAALDFELLCSHPVSKLNQ